MQAYLRVKEVIADRFEIDRVAGSGGMGVVYRARDHHTGEWVALKVLHQVSRGSQETRRFIREASILAELRHPGIVSHITSGRAHDGLYYLAMEWLEGEDLAQRMRRGPLSAQEGHRLLRQVAEALAFAHQRGVVHRDIKPSNLFLCNHQFDRVVLLDFGVAHYLKALADSVLTVAGTVIGTLEYMAPEQARAEQTITAAADIYSLGKVVYQGLSGQKRRESGHFAAALARTLFEESPPLPLLPTGQPHPLSELLLRMLAKEPSRRPASGTALLDVLPNLGPLPDVTLAAPAELPFLDPEVAYEQSLYTVILAVPANATEPERTVGGEPPSLSRNVQLELETTLVNHHASSRWLFDGSLLVIMELSACAHDQALSAARCALIVKSRWPEVTVAVATGRGQLSQQGLIGEVVDRAALLLRERQSAAQENPRVAAIESLGVWLDELSASLLERHFVLVPAAKASILTGEVLCSNEARPVLGVHLPCIGREEELSQLDALVKRCRDDCEPQAVLITGPPGQGKTRLRQEFLRRLRRRSWPRFVGLGIGDSLATGACYSLLGQAIRRLCGIDSAALPAMAYKRLTEFCQNFLGAEAGSRAALCLSEMCGLSAPFGESLEPGRTYSDPSALFAQLLQVLPALFSACCERASVVLVLDDVHWADKLSLQLVDSLLHEMQGRPFMVLALGRPEVLTTFPQVQQWPQLKKRALGGLSSGACECIIRFVLGDRIEPEGMAQLVRHAGGNALLLEELLRAHRDPQGEVSSETVLAILQARMQRLGFAERMLLGQASVFGQRFWRGGLLAILAGDPLAIDVDTALHGLTQAELIAANKHSRLSGELEYTFCHPLMREAAYALLPDAQKQRWHRLAAQFLEEAGESAAAVLAEHFRHSDAPSRAVRYYIRAAGIALEGHDMTGAKLHVERGLSCQAPGSAQSSVQRREYGELLAIQTTALHFSSEHQACIRLGEKALRWLPAGGVFWCRTMKALLGSASLLGDGETLNRLAGSFMNMSPPPEAVEAYLATGGILVNLFGLSGQGSAGRAMLSRMENLAAGRLQTEPTMMAWLRFGQHSLARWLEGDPMGAWKYAQEAVSAALSTGNRRWIGIMEGAAALAGLELGQPAAACEAALWAAHETLGAIGAEDSQDFLASSAALWLSAQAGRADEAARLAQTVAARDKRNALADGLALWALSQVHLAAQRLQDAENEAQAALELLREMPPLCTGVHAQLLRVLLRAGRLQQAGVLATQSRRELEELGGVSFMDQALRVSIVEVRWATGDRDGAIAELRIALYTLQERAARIATPRKRRRYLEHVAENARLTALGRELLGEEPLLSLLPTW